MKTKLLFLAALVLVYAPYSLAEVVETSASTMAITQVRTVTAPPAKAWDALVNVGGWWSSDHTYSGNAANLRLEPRAGGCWCESLPDGGSVQHMTVVFAQPKHRLTLSGGLGPLQSGGLSGSMTIQITAKGTGAQIAMRYNVGGYFPGGLDKISAGVDAVLDEQFSRLARLADTGSADEKK